MNPANGVNIRVFNAPINLWCVGRIYFISGLKFWSSDNQVILLQVLVCIDFCIMYFILFYFSCVLIIYLLCVVSQVMLLLSYFGLWWSLTFWMIPRWSGTNLLTILFPGCQYIISAFVIFNFALSVESLQFQNIITYIKKWHISFVIFVEIGWDLD